MLRGLPVISKLLLAIGFLLFNSPLVYGQTSSSNWGSVLLPGPICFNSQVNSAVASSNTIFVGGYFDKVGRCAGNGKVVNDTTAASTFPNFPAISGTVFTAIPDGSNGWYIGGDFTQIGGVTRNRLAQIDSSGNLTSWNPNSNSTVMSLVKVGGIIYIGGWFTTISGTGRNYVAAVDTAGTLQAFNPSPNNTVNFITYNGSSIYIGGTFTIIAGTTTGRLARVDTSGVLDTTWIPSVNGTVRALVFSATTVYVGGQFTSVVGPTARNYAAAISLSSPATATAWNPNPADWVRGLATDGTQIWMGGYFQTVGGTSRTNLASVDMTTGALNAWSPQPDGTVFAVYYDGTNLFVGGDFTTFTTSGASRYSAAKLNPASNTPLAWQPDPSSTVRAYAPDALGNIFIGGYMTFFGGYTRKFIAAMDFNGNLMSFDGLMDGVLGSHSIQALKYDKVTDTVYGGGQFTKSGGVAATNLAAFQKSGATSFRPSLNNAIQGLELDSTGTIIYATGYFTLAGGSTRNRAAAFASDGTLQAWDPNANNVVYNVVRYGNDLFLAGQFGTIGGTARPYLARVDSTGALTSWTVALNSYAIGMELIGSELYIGGAFSTIGGAAHQNVGGIDIPSATPLAWAPSTNGSCYHFIKEPNGDIIFTGSYSTVNTVPRTVVRTNSSGTLTSWDPNADAWAMGAFQIGQRLWIYGSFSRINGKVRTGLTEVDLVTGIAR